MDKISGNVLGLDVCPHCGKEVDFLVSGNTAYIICSDRNCLGGSRISWGSNDKAYIFIEKLKSNWNKRCANQNALIKAIEYLEEFRDEVYNETQIEDAERWSCCLDTLDEAINKAKVFVL